MKGIYPCPKCGKNDWTPVTWVDGPPYDECNGCGHHFTSKDIPKNRWNKFWEEIDPEQTKDLEDIYQSFWEGIQGK